MDLSHFERPPFDLDREAIDWVRRTWESLDEGTRVAQLFNLRSKGFDEGEPDRVAGLAPGGVTRFFGDDFAAERDRLTRFQSDAAVPMLVSADLEGSRMSLPYGTQVPNPIALAAIDDVEVTEEVTRIMAREGRAAGVNWTFAPVLDINAAWRSSIVATRGFGADPDLIERQALAQIRGFQEEGVAATAEPSHDHGQRFSRKISAGRVQRVQ